MSDSPSPQARERLRRQKIERQLDEALAATFPASDPVAIASSYEEEEDRGPDAAAPRAPDRGPGPKGR
jgi:hypothetical protein